MVPLTPNEILNQLEEATGQLSKATNTESISIDPGECARLLERLEGVKGGLEGVKARLWSRIMMPVSVEPQTQEKLTIEEVARELRMKPSWVREKARRGELEGYKSGKEWRFHRQDVDRFQATLEGKPLTPKKDKIGNSRRGNVSIFQPSKG